MLELLYEGGKEWFFLWGKKFERQKNFLIVNEDD